jgi:hypothetical protein
MNILQDIKTIQISTKDSIITNSMFGPKQITVYKVPTIDECIGLLPKYVGNYILSYTYAWVEFYLDNLVEKFGYYFVTFTLNLNFNIKGKSKFTQYELYKNVIKYIRDKNISKSYIRDRFQIAIPKKLNEIFLENQKKEQKLLKRQIDLTKIQIGSIFLSSNYNVNYLFLVVQKTAKQYYSIRIIIENETDTQYIIKYSAHPRSPNNHNILLNVPILETEHSIKPVKALKIKNFQNQYTDAVFDQKTKKLYFMTLFR